jgi:hypothetical protein
MEHIRTAVASLTSNSNSHDVPQNAMIPITREGDLPAIYDPEIHGLCGLIAFYEGPGGVASGTPVLRRALKASEQSKLERRVIELRRTVAPFDSRNRDSLIQAISGMIGSYQMMQKFNKATALTITAGYLWTARQRPHWAIKKACAMVRDGTAGLNPMYCPSEAEFNLLIGRLIEPYTNALHNVERLIKARVELPQPPKLTREEIEAKLGRPLGTAAALKPQAQSSPAHDGKHMQRVLADLAARKMRRESLPARILPDSSEPTPCRD